MFAPTRELAVDADQTRRRSRCVGVFQAACVAVLAGAYHVSTPEAIAYGIVLQGVEVAAALIMGLPALLNEGLSWRDVRLRTMHAAPVKLPILPQSQYGAVRSH
jgi:phosphatidylinositol alpha-mannosyltransferase